MQPWRSGREAGAIQNFPCGLPGQDSPSDRRKKGAGMMGEDRRNNEKAAGELTNTKQTRSLSSCSRRAFLAGIGAGLGGVSPFVANASA